MKTIKTLTLAACLAVAGTAFAQDAMKKDDAMGKQEMTMQDCKDHMAMAKKDGMKKDDAMAMKKDHACADMMKKDEMMKKDGAMKK